jgi:hypothetical protein
VNISNSLFITHLYVVLAPPIQNGFMPADRLLRLIGFDVVVFGHISAHQPVIQVFAFDMLHY